MSEARPSVREVAASREGRADELFAYYLVLRRSPQWARLSNEEREQAVARAAETLGVDAGSDRPGQAETSHGPVTVRGIYSVSGFRPDADLMLWWVAPSAEAIQTLFTELRRSALGRHLEPTWTFLGLHRPAEFNPEHIPAFVTGHAPKRYLCVYPFVRTPEWYLLDPPARAALLREHGEKARPYPDVLANTTAAFGLGDYEWILAFEADQLARLVDMIRALRSAEARRYTRLETPFVTGVRKSLRDAARDMA